MQKLLTVFVMSPVAHKFVVYRTAYKPYTYLQPKIVRIPEIVGPSESPRKLPRSK